jgi:hypothetical protein
MESDDWVKFGAVIWANRSQQRQQLTLDFYKAAWRKRYHTEPLLNSDGGPADFLYNPQYTLSKPVPWLAAALAEDCAALSTSNIADEDTSHLEPGPSTTATAIQVPIEAEAGPSMPGRSATRPATRPANILPSDSPISSPCFDTPPNVGEIYDISCNPSLQDILSNCPYKVDTLSPFPKIKDGFLPGFQQYLEDASFKRLRVIFPIIPQYRIQSQTNRSTPYINLIEMSPKDVGAISEVDPQCLCLSADQNDCQAGQVKYFCSSWVSL